MFRKYLQITLLNLLVICCMAAHAMPTMVADRLAAVCSDTGRLSGRVTNSQQQPLANAEIQLWRDQRNETTRQRELVKVTQQRADSQGKFQFVDLAPGAYTLFAKAEDEQYSALYYGNVPLRNQAQFVDVQAQHETQEVNISLPQSMTLSGVAHDEAGKPLVKVTVKLALRDNGQTYPLSETNTDSDGRYQFKKLAPAAYVLSATHDNYQSSANTAIQLSLANDKPVQDLTLTHYAERAYLEGKVVGTDGKPLKFVLVKVQRLLDANMLDSRSELQFTDEWGRYEFALPAAGQYHLHFSFKFDVGQPFQSGLPDPIEQSYQSSAAAPKGEAVSLQLGASTLVATQQLPVSITPALQGTVKFATPPYDNFYEEWRVKLFHWQAGRWQLFMSTTTGYGSRYSFINVPSGEYRIGFEPSYSSRYQAHYYPHATTLDEAQTIVITAGKVLDIDTELALRQIELSLAYVGKFDLIEPVSPTDFRLMGIRNSGDYNYTDFRLEFDAQGHFKLFIAPASFLVVYSHYRLIYQAQENSTYMSTAIDLPPRAANGVIDNVQLRLPLGAQIKGRLVDHIGKPLVGISLYSYSYRYEPTIDDLSIKLRTVTDNQGRYHFKGLDTGTYLLGTQTELPYSRGVSALYNYAQSAPQYPTTFYKQATSPTLATGINISAGGTGVNKVIPLDAGDLQLAQGGCMAGQVTDSIGQPLAHVRVKVSSANDPGWLVGSPSYTDAEGRYLINRLNPGQYRVSFERADLGEMSYAPTLVSVQEQQKTTGIDPRFVNPPQCRDESLNPSRFFRSIYTYDDFTDDHLTRYSANFYDVQSKRLTLQRISLNGQLHQALLQDVGNYTFKLLDASALNREPWPSIWGEASYDIATQTATLPRVYAFGQHYCVQLVREPTGLFRLHYAKQLTD